MGRYARVLRNGERRWVEAGDDVVRVLSGDPFLASTHPEETLLREDLDRLSFTPPTDAAKIVGLAFNYKSLVGAREDYDEPLFFLKSPTSACGHKARISRPRFATKVWVEVELGVIIKKECRSVSVDDASDYILGYTIGSDVTAENIYGRDWHLARSKALDGFAPLGPFLVTDLDTSDLAVETRINGRLFQQGRTSDRILNDRESVSLISQYLTLTPGDVILTGTPAGATDSLVSVGDTVTHRIEGIGELSFDFV
jgi:2-keto-4-pentenoate hydratase/2-oxohepta-3-ene-1,7-dioic acid hydratase in catechol pathway